MQAIANEMNFSETTFVLPSEQSETDFRLRIFTPGIELPMAGHPTIGSAFALARAGVLEPGREALRVRPRRRTDAGDAQLEGKRPRLRLDDAASADLLGADRESRRRRAGAGAAGGGSRRRRAAGAGRLVRSPVSHRPAGDARAPWTTRPATTKRSMRSSGHRSGYRIASATCWPRPSPPPGAGSRPPAKGSRTSWSCEAARDVVELGTEVLDRTGVDPELIDAVATRLHRIVDDTQRRRAS